MSARRRSGKEVRQKGHGKKRGPGWHTGRSSEKHALPKMDAIAKAEERAREQEEQIKRDAVQTKRDVRDYEQMLAGLERAAPYVPSFGGDIVIAA